MTKQELLAALAAADARVAQRFPGADARARVQSALRAYGAGDGAAPSLREVVLPDTLAWLVAGALARRYGIPYGKAPRGKHKWLVDAPDEFVSEVFAPAVKQTAEAFWQFTVDQANEICWEALPPLGAEISVQILARR